LPDTVTDEPEEPLLVQPPIAAATRAHAHIARPHASARVAIVDFG
jgi:hypothetical protein